MWYLIRFAVMVRQLLLRKERSVSWMGIDDIQRILL